MVERPQASIAVLSDSRRANSNLHSFPTRRSSDLDPLGGFGGDVEGYADIAARRREDRRVDADHLALEVEGRTTRIAAIQDRKSTRLNSSHSSISYAVFCLKKKKPT